jgi:hypothetical protein
MRRAKQRLQNVHRFLEDGATDPARRPPPDRLIVFDEAQRAWERDEGAARPRATSRRSSPAASRRTRWRSWAATMAGLWWSR